MASISSPHSTSWTFVLLCLAGLATAQSVAPVNGTSPKLQRNETDDIGLQLVSANGLPFPPILDVVPLIDSASAATAKLPAHGLTGTIFDASASNVGNITSASIAWISCDPSNYPGNLGAVDVLQQAVENKAAAALLYSRTSSYCNYTAGPKVSPDYAFLYAMSKTSDAFIIYNMLHLNPDATPMRASINMLERLAANNSTGGGNNGQNGTPSNQQPGGPSPSTAVAMIILYSITGVITALFLIIIITGAIRAHRHPERYGPRAMLGRARQTRAKGLARAMLDSIPIVKFGDDEHDTPKPEDVELAAASSSTNEHGESAEAREGDQHEAMAETAERRSSEAGPVERRVSRESEEGGIGADVAPPSTHSNPPEQLGCSICTEDFERGEDVRVLPCDHKFHPACIDPWLLNVSGTCPLCRIDLRPPTSHNPDDPDNPDADENNDGAPNPAESTPNADSNANLQPGETPRRQSRRFSSFIFDPLNRRRMEHATPEERIEALRQYNARRAASAEQDSRRRRISNRLSDAFGRRRNDDSSAEASRSVTPAGNGSSGNVAPMLSPLSFEERARNEEEAGHASAGIDEITSAPEIRVQAPDGEKERPPTS